MKLLIAILASPKRIFMFQLSFRVFSLSATHRRALPQRRHSCRYRTIVQRQRIRSTGQVQVCVRSPVLYPFHVWQPAAAGVPETMTKTKHTEMSAQLAPNWQVLNKNPKEGCTGKEEYEVHVIQHCNLQHSFKGQQVQITWGTSLTLRSRCGWIAVKRTQHRSI